MAVFEEPHLQGVIDLCVKEGWPTYPSDPARALRALRALLAPGAVTAVEVDADGRVVGFAHGFGDQTTAYLAQLLVDPAYRGKGLGRRLVNEIADRSGVERLDLRTDAAAGFYASFPHRAYDGFRIYPRHLADPRSGAAPAVPTLDAGDVTLRPFWPEDVELALAASRDPLIPLITSVPADADETAARAWIDLQHTRVRTGVGHLFAITDAATGGAPPRDPSDHPRSTTPDTLGALPPRRVTAMAAR